MAVIEKLGQFYLGRMHNLDAGETSSQELHYDAGDLTTHAVCVGMTGSGKTGLCLSLLEEAAIDGIPAIAIDPKGDLGNLMLAFPNLAPADFQPWVDPDEARRRGLTVPEFATQTADTWRKGLAEWNQGPDRLQTYTDAVDISIYTPASSAGKPLTVLRSFTAPDRDGLDAGEVLRERIMAAVSGLLALMQIDADPMSSREHILLSTILEAFWRDGKDVDMETLIRSIQAPPFDKVGFLDLQSFFPASDRFKLAVLLNNLLASPSFAAWLEGEPLDIQQLYYSPDGKPRLSIISIAHLSDAERMFFVTILMTELIAWMRNQPGTSSLRALLYMDEVFGYLPPTANPPSKQPILTLLKQARAYGLGCILATQNPADIDYKGLSNAGTWFLGRLQTERDKMRVLEGLEGAAASAGSTFDRQKMEQTLAGLQSRVFLMNNVHEDQPVVFKTRWALSYLRGPITRHQIRTLMAPWHAAKETTPTFGLKAEAEGTDGAARPVLPPAIPETFLPSRHRHHQLTYQPALMGVARVHFISSRFDVDCWDEVTLLRVTGHHVTADLWHDADEWDEDDFPEPEHQPEANAAWRELAPELTQKKSYSKWSSLLKDYLYRNRRLSVWTCPALDQRSRQGESESDFRIRLRHAAREARDLQVGKLRKKYASRFRTLEDQIRRAQQKIEREQLQKNQSRISTLISVGTSIAGALLGRKLASAANVSRAGTAIRSAGRMSKEAEDVRHAEESLQALTVKRHALDAEVEDEVQIIQDQFDPDRLLEINNEEIKPRKSDLSIDQVTLVWLPYAVDDNGQPARAF
jgi:hypothetical protein